MIMKGPDGVEREVTPEEFKSMLANGKLVGIQKITTDENGNQTVTDVFGNQSETNDRLDRSINAFCSSKDLQFLATVLGDLINQSSKLADESKKEYKGFVETIDITDGPTTIKLTADETTQKVNIRMFVRDYQKSEASGLQVYFREWNLDGDKISLDGNMIQKEMEEDERFIFYLGALALRIYLKNTGFYTRLKELKGKGAGVVVSVSEDEEISAKIVQGKERPDLPCAGSLLGTIMARPYADEMISDMMSSGESIEGTIKEAEDGDEVCMADLAMLYTNGDDETQQDPRKAVYWLQKLADTGNAVGMFNLGLYCAKGFGTERDLEKAAFWMEKAAQAGDKDAPAVAQRYRKMAADLEKAESGDAQAQADVAIAFMQLGNSLDPAGPGKDYEDGLYWARKAEAQDCPDAMWVLALAYQHGRGVEPDAETAVAYYEKGAALGNAACRHSLGCEYMTGTHLKQDKKKGFELFLQSAEQGYGLAMRDVGYCYQMGDGCTGNLKKAAEWYEKALEKIDEPEVEQRLALIKIISENDEDWDNDYDEMPKSDEKDDENAEVYCGFCGKGPLTDEQKKQFESWDGFYCSQECLDKRAEAFHREVFGDLFESFEAGKTPEEIAAERGADLTAIKKILGLE